MNNSQRQSLDSSVCVPDSSELHSQYTALPSYEQYPNGYTNSSIYVTKSPALAISRISSVCSTYRPDQTSCGVIGSQDKLTTTSQEVSDIHEHTLVPAVKFIHSQYDEIPEYEIGAQPCSSESHYVENPSVTYGYLSEANYGIPTSSINITSYSPRPTLFDDNLNGADSAMPIDVNVKSLGNHPEFQIRMSQLALNPVDGVSQIRDMKDKILDGAGSDIFSTMRWRDPNLSEVISFLNNPNNAIKANAAAYLQHLCYMDDPNKQRTRTLGGIPPLIHLLSYDNPEIFKNACGALRNLSYGRQNDENKRAIKDAGGIVSLVNLLCRTQESEVKELVTGILWNMSSCEDIKRSIIDEALFAIVTNLIKPHSGWDPISPGDVCFSTVFRNASGVLRNVSSAGEYARSSLRDSEQLVECLIYVIKIAIEKNNIGNKTVENCVCILRNLSYRCQEVEDPNYDKQTMVTPIRALSPSCKGENLGCFGTSKKKKDFVHNELLQENIFPAGINKNPISTSGLLKGYEQLWQPEVVQYYLSILQSCSNPETLEAAAGAIQNLSACFWQPSIDIRATVRKEKGLPILVELLRMEVDRVVCAVATALRNLAIDQRNKELIGKYAMRDLVQKLPSGNQQHDQNTSDDTISAVLATINEVIKKNPEFSRSLLDAGGVERLMNITRQRQSYTTCVLKFAGQVLFTMWQHHELRDVYKKNGWKEFDFVTKLFTVQYSPNSPNNSNNTLNRPMASQGRTRYEDRTIQRVSSNAVSKIESESHTIGKDSSILYQVGDDLSAAGVGNEIYQRGSQSSSGAAYIPIIEKQRNVSHKFA